MHEQIKLSEREKLCALFQIMHLQGWDDLIVTHFTIRTVNNTLLTHEFGLNFDEITPDNLVEIDFDGTILNPQDAWINRNGMSFHRDVYRARSDVNCIIHTHSKAGTAFSILKHPLKMLDQLTMMFHDNIAYHEFDQLFIKDKNQQLLDELGNKNTMILRNHGLVVVGHSIERAFWDYYHLDRACQTQLMALSTGQELLEPSKAIVEDTCRTYNDNWFKPQGNDEPGMEVLAFQSMLRRLRNKNLPPFRSA